MRLSARTLLPRAVIPPVLGAMVAYPTIFLMHMDRDLTPSGDADNGRTIASGSLTGAWRYDITQRAFSSTYRVMLTPTMAERPVGVCAVEVRGGPRPTLARLGDGGFLQVAFERPLLGYMTRTIEVNLAAALDNPCAAIVTDGVVMGPNGLPHSVAHLGDQPILKPPGA